MSRAGPQAAAGDAPAAPPAVAASTHEAGTALRNAFKLGASMIVTWGVAVGVRILLPRYLGPAPFGALNFADAFTGLVFLVLGLGIDTYVRKEVSVRPAHVNDFFGGVLLARLALAGVALGGVLWMLRASGRSPEVMQAVYLFALYQLLLTHNTTLAAVLQAHGTVGGLSVANVATKALWACGVVLALLFGARLWAVALAFVVSELVKAAVLTTLARRHAGLRHRWRARAALQVIVTSLPFFAHMVVVAAGARLAVNVLAFTVGSDREVGWFAASMNLAGAALLLAPIISSVLTPLFARASARSDAELDAALRRSVEVILTLAVPAALLGALGADLWTRLLLGDSFAPATDGLRILLTTLPLTYLNIVSGSVLVLRNRGWTLTLVASIGLAVDLVACLLLIPPARAHLGPGGAGTACATASLVHEVVATALMFSVLGRRCLDRRTLLVLPKLAVACAAAVAVDRSLTSLPPVARVAADTAAYLLAAALLDGARMRALLSQARQTLRRSPVQAASA